MEKNGKYFYIGLIIVILFFIILGCSYWLPRFAAVDTQLNLIHNKQESLNKRYDNLMQEYNEILNEGLRWEGSF